MTILQKEFEIRASQSQHVLLTKYRIMRVIISIIHDKYMKDKFANIFLMVLMREEVNSIGCQSPTSPF